MAVTWSDPLVTNSDDETGAKVEALKQLEPARNDDE